MKNKDLTIKNMYCRYIGDVSMLVSKNLVLRLSKQKFVPCCKLVGGSPLFSLGSGWPSARRHSIEGVGTPLALQGRVTYTSQLINWLAGGIQDANAGASERQPASCLLVILTDIKGRAMAIFHSIKWRIKVQPGWWKSRQKNKLLAISGSETWELSGIVTNTLKEPWLRWDWL